ncbi:MAG: hypothetical protein IKL25_06675 [Clostridia bacterium]|nr:hypothetical protein [Clostridia bacterium]
MKRMLAFVLAMMMFALPCLAEENVGGADGPTSVWIDGDQPTAETMMADAVAAGRRVTVNAYVHEIAGVSTGDEMADAAIVDFFSALGVWSAQQGDEIELGLTLSQQDVLNFGCTVSGDDVYVRTNLIGGTIVFTMQEIEPIINRVLDMLVQMDAITAEEADEIRVQVPVFLAQLESSFTQGANSTITPEDLLTMDFSALEGVYAYILTDLEPVDSIAVPRMCDQATSGVRLSMNNKEFTNLFRALFQFIKDNPKLMENIAANGEYPTAESRAADWAANGWAYRQFGIYESEEEYNAANPTLEEALDMLIAEVDTIQMIDGEFVTTIYFDDAGQVVYLTCVLPMYTEQEPLYEGAVPQGITQILNVVYSRQTVAQGVSHVCNIDVDGEGVTVDVLAQENSWIFRMNDMASQDTVLTINAAKENGMIKGSFDTHEAGIEGSFAFFHTVSESQFKTEMAFEMHTNDTYAARHPNENPEALSFHYTCDYARDGVDFSGREVVDVAYNDFKVVVYIDTATGEPEESIMAGQVIRPAELDDSAFANWFVSAYNAVYSWTGRTLMALPESVLTLILSSSSMGY